MKLAQNVHTRPLPSRFLHLAFSLQVAVGTRLILKMAEKSQLLKQAIQPLKPNQPIRQRPRLATLAALATNYDAKNETIFNYRFAGARAVGDYYLGAKNIYWRDGLKFIIAA